MKRRDTRRVVAIATILFAGVQLCLAGAAWFVRRQAEGALAGARDRIGWLEVELADAAARASEPAPPAPAAASRVLPANADVSGTMAVLQSLADAADVTLHAVKATHAGPGRQSFTLGGRGAPAAVCDFLGAVERHERLLVVENGKLTPAGGGEVAFDFGITTVHAGGER